MMRTSRGSRVASLFVASLVASLLVNLAANVAAADDPDRPVGGREAPSGEAPDCSAEVAARVQSHYDSVSDFRARFGQVTRSVTLGSATLGADAPSTGVVQLAKPGKMRWSYETPTPSLVVSNGKTLWLYDPGAGEVQRLPVTQGYLTGAALSFLLGDGKLSESFEIQAVDCKPDDAGTLLLELTPRQPASYQRLGMRVAEANGSILESDVVDLFGNRTQISFSEVETNLSPTDSVFDFEVPEGVMVIDLAPPE
jgi:outer membrane lipoprotein carrier protein